MLGQPLAGGPAADAGVEEQTDLPGLDVDAIAVAAGLKGDDPHKGNFKRLGAAVSRGWGREFISCRSISPGPGVERRPEGA